MKRGRIFIYLALIILVAVGAFGFYLWKQRSGTTTPKPGSAQVTPQVTYVDIVSAGQNISPGTAITESMLSSYQIPANKLVQGEFTNKADVVNMYARYTILQNLPITDAMVSMTPGNVNLPGSPWAPFIPQGLTAISIPVDELSTVSFGVREGDYVNIIVTMLLVDIDPAMQSILPNLAAGVTAPGLLNTGAQTLTVQIAAGGDAARVGQTVLDSTLNQPIYLVPSEGQRPRIVTQTILQKVQVLHMGVFPLPGESANANYSSATTIGTPTPVAPGQQAVTGTVPKPDIVTLMVTPQDANTLAFLIYSKAMITLTLCNPNDQSPAAKTDAAMLEYLLTQYNIPVPAKLPYGMQPRLDVLMEPTLSYEATPIH